MNILVPYKKLSEIVKTNLPVEKAADLITLRSSSVEKIEKIEGDDVLDIEITPNRGDNLSVLGIAREFFAICKAEGIEAEFIDPLKHTDSIAELQNDPSASVGQTKKELKITIEEQSLCPRFTAVVVDNVKITDSPAYIKTFLTQVGMRPINNIVDLTNYIMMLTGQPMHAFDYNKISGGEMKVRESKEGEELVTLDGQLQKLPIGSVVINDDKRIIDLCGIMGGENSAIDENTKTVVLFTQIYDKYKLRKTSLALNHRTEAVLRFEKGLDPLLQDKALFKALLVLKESTNYDVVSQLYDINTTTVNQKEVEMRYEKLNILAGSKLQIAKSEEILKALGFEVVENTEEKIKVKVPSYRLEDISIEEDLIEEVIRIYGYEKIGLVLPNNYFSNDIYDNTNKVERIIKNYLKNIGYNEVLTISMVSKNKVNEKIAVKIDNPLGADMEYMRTTQESILKEALENNRGEVNVFELSKVYKLNGDELPKEYKKLAILTNAVNSDEKVVNSIKNLLRELRISPLRSVGASEGHANYELKIKTNNILIFINNKLSGKIYFRDTYTFAELLFKNLVKNYSDYPNIPTEYNTNVIVEDFTIHTPLDSVFSKIAKKIKKVDERILSVEYADSYIKENSRALTITLKYQNKVNDLNSNEVTVIRNKIIYFVEKELGYTVDRKIQ